MLEDGADAERQALARRADAHGPAAQADLAGVGLVDAGEQADQRRLAGAVLAEQHMDLAGMEIEGDVVVGDDAGERLGDAAQGYGGRGMLPAPTSAGRCGVRRSHGLTNTVEADARSRVPSNVEAGELLNHHSEDFRK